MIGFLALFDELLVEGAHAVECLVRRPGSLATLLEAAGELVLERAGAILDARVAGLDPDIPEVASAST